MSLAEVLDVVANDSLEVVLEVLHDDEDGHVVLVLAFGVVRILARNNQVEQLRHVF